MMSTIDAEDAWWPPTFTPLVFGRVRLAASTIAADSQSTRLATSRSTSGSSRAGAAASVGPDQVAVIVPATESGRR